MEYVPGTGWAAHVPEEAGTTDRGRVSSLHTPVDEPPSLTITPVAAASSATNVLASKSDAHLEGMRDMLRVMGNVPDSILNSTNKEVILAFFQGLSLIHI